MFKVKRRSELERVFLGTSLRLNKSQISEVFYFGDLFIYLAKEIMYLLRYHSPECKRKHRAQAGYSLNYYHHYYY